MLCVFEARNCGCRFRFNSILSSQLFVYDDKSKHAFQGFNKLDFSILKQIALWSLGDIDIERDWDFSVNFNYFSNWNELEVDALNV